MYCAHPDRIVCTTQISATMNSSSIRNMDYQRTQECILVELQAKYVRLNLETQVLKR